MNCLLHSPTSQCPEGATVNSVQPQASWERRLQHAAFCQRSSQPSTPNLSCALFGVGNLKCSYTAIEIKLKQIHKMHSHHFQENVWSLFSQYSSLAYVSKPLFSDCKVTVSKLSVLKSVLMLSAQILRGDGCSILFAFA